MGKNSLIGRSVWDKYSQKVQGRMNNPQHMGESSEEDAKVRNTKLIIIDSDAKSCGDAVRLFWFVDEKADKIIDAEFKSFGRSTTIANNDTMVDLCIGKTVNEVVKITNLDVEFAMRDNPEAPAVPPQKMYCSVMIYDVTRQATAHYKGIDPEDLEDQIIVCEYARVSLGAIKEVIKPNDLRTIEEITQYAKAGAFCKSCIKPGGHEKKDYHLVSVLTEARAGMDRERLKNTMKSDIAFDEMTVVGQSKTVKSVLDAEIRPMLHNNDEGLEAIDIQKAEGAAIDVYIRYLGTRSGCSSGNGVILYAIETTLQEELNPNIRVMPV